MYYIIWFRPGIDDHVTISKKVDKLPLIIKEIITKLNSTSKPLIKTLIIMTCVLTCKEMGTLRKMSAVNSRILHLILDNLTHILLVHQISYNY